MSKVYNITMQVSVPDELSAEDVEDNLGFAIEFANALSHDKCEVSFIIVSDAEIDARKN